MRGRFWTYRNDLSAALEVVIVILNVRTSKEWKQILSVGCGRGQNRKLGSKLKLPVVQSADDVSWHVKSRVLLGMAQEQAKSGVEYKHPAYSDAESFSIRYTNIALVSRPRTNKQDSQVS